MFSIKIFKRGKFCMLDKIRVTVIKLYGALNCAFFLMPI